MKKIIIASDSFKGTLSSNDICDIAKDCINETFPDCKVIQIPIADGGEGTVDCFIKALNAKRINVTVNDSYMNKIGVFKSKEELEAKSKDIFGIKFLYSGITKACCTGAMYKKHYFI